MESEVGLESRSVNSGLGIRVALDTNGLPRTLSGAGVGLRALTTNRQTAKVALPAVGLDGLKALQVDAKLTAEIALDDILAVLDRLNDLGQLLFREVPSPDRTVYLRPLKHLDRIDRSKAINVAESDVDPLLAGYVNTKDTWHKFEFLALPLLVTRVRADHADHALPTNHLAVLAKLFY